MSSAGTVLTAAPADPGYTIISNVLITNRIGMRVAVYYTNKDVRIEERPVPQPGPGEILVKTEACGVCVADTMEWYLTPRAPLVLGHEPTGIIAGVGANTTNFKEGDRVAIHHHVPCLICDHCRQGNFTMCATFKNTHIKPGGFSEYFTASPLHVEHDTHILPPQLSFETGTLMEPLACVIHAIRKANIRPGDSVVLIGTGTMGLLFIQALKFFGVNKLVVYEMIEWRKQKALEFGAPLVLKPSGSPEEEAEKVRQQFGGRLANKVIIAAKDLKAMELGMRLVEKGGTVLFFATPRPDEFINFYPSYIFFNEISTTSSYSADHTDTRMAMELLASGIVAGDGLISHVFPLERLSDAILQTINREGSLKCVIKFD
jgi:L-iditol 2-dehydrogenase